MFEMRELSSFDKMFELYRPLAELQLQLRNPTLGRANRGVSLRLHGCNEK